jgi:hypothetical protein
MQLQSAAAVIGSQTAPDHVLACMCRFMQGTVRGRCSSLCFVSSLCVLNGMGKRVCEAEHTRCRAGMWPTVHHCKLNHN